MKSAEPIEPPNHVLMPGLTLLREMSRKGELAETCFLVPSLPLRESCGIISLRIIKRTESV